MKQHLLEKIYYLRLDYKELELQQFDPTFESIHIPKKEGFEEEIKVVTLLNRKSQENLDYLNISQDVSLLMKLREKNKITQESMLRDIYHRLILNKKVIVNESIDKRLQEVLYKIILKGKLKLTVL